MNLFFFVISFIVINLVTKASSWQYFTTFEDLTMTGSAKDKQTVHTMYYYGDCTFKQKVLYTTVFLDHLQVLGKIIIRGWLKNVRAIPTCVVLMARAHPEDTFRSTAFQFQICVPRVTYIHSQRRKLYYYYEWYIPPDMVGGMNWEIRFFGTKDYDWE